MSIIEEFNIPMRMDAIKNQSMKSISAEKKLQLLMVSGLTSFNFLSD